MKSGLAYFGVKDPELVKQQMTQFIDDGYTHICFPYSEDDFTYHRQVLRKIINQTVEQGLKVYVTPYGIGNVFKGKALSSYALRNPQESQINNLGEIEDAVCFNQSNFRSYVRNWIEEVTDLNIETVLWSIPYFSNSKSPDQWSCSCTVCHKLFRKIYPHMISTSLTDNVKNFRENAIFDFVSEITGLVRTKHKRNALAVNFRQFEEIKQNPDLSFLKKLMELPMLDEISFQPYWEPNTRPIEIAKRYHSYSRYLLDFAKEYQKEAQIWIKNFEIKKDNENTVSEATHASYNEGVRNIFAWSAFGSRASDESSDCPEKVFNIQTNALADCLEKDVLNEMIETMRSKD